MTGMEWTGLDWTGLDWAGLDWTGLDWTGLGFEFEFGFGLDTLKAHLQLISVLTMPIRSIRLQFYKYENIRGNPNSFGFPKHVSHMGRSCFGKTR